MTTATASIHQTLIADALANGWCLAVEVESDGDDDIASLLCQTDTSELHGLCLEDATAGTHDEREEMCDLLVRPAQMGGLELVARLEAAGFKRVPDTYCDTTVYRIA